MNGSKSHWTCQLAQQGTRDFAQQIAQIRKEDFGPMSVFTFSTYFAVILLLLTLNYALVSVPILTRRGLTKIEPHFAKGRIVVMTFYQISYELLTDVYVAVVQHVDDNPFYSDSLLQKTVTTISAVCKAEKPAFDEISKKHSELWFSLESLLDYTKIEVSSDNWESVEKKNVETRDTLDALFAIDFEIPSNVLPTSRPAAFGSAFGERANDTPSVPSKRSISSKKSKRSLTVDSATSNASTGTASTNSTSGSKKRKSSVEEDGNSKKSSASTGSKKPSPDSPTKKERSSKLKVSSESLEAPDLTSASNSPNASTATLTTTGSANSSSSGSRKLRSGTSNRKITTNMEGVTDLSTYPSTVSASTSSHTASTSKETSTDTSKSETKLSSSSSSTVDPDSSKTTSTNNADNSKKSGSLNNSTSDSISPKSNGASSATLSLPSIQIDNESKESNSSSTNDNQSSGYVKSSSSGRTSPRGNGVKPAPSSSTNSTTSEASIHHNNNSGIITNVTHEDRRSPEQSISSSPTYLEAGSLMIKLGINPLMAHHPDDHYDAMNPEDHEDFSHMTISGQAPISHILDTHGEEDLPSAAGDALFWKTKSNVETFSSSGLDTPRILDSPPESSGEEDDEDEGGKSPEEDYESKSTGSKLEDPATMMLSHHRVLVSGRSFSGISTDSATTPRGRVSDDASQVEVFENIPEKRDEETD